MQAGSASSPPVRSGGFEPEFDKELKKATDLMEKEFTKMGGG